MDLDASAVKVALLTSAYTPDIDAHHYFTSVSAQEVAGDGYTAGGYTLTGVSATVDKTNNLAYLDCGNPTWTSATLSNVRFPVIYRDTGDAATAPLLGYINLGSNKTITDGTFTLTVSASGLLRLT